MNDLQRINFVYQPVKDDLTDKKLAEYINNCQSHSKASLFFVKEPQEGVYTYGRRRLFIKVSENDQVIVRVGGGYETIDRFIENHCPFEVRKRQKTHFNNFLSMKAMQLDSKQGGGGTGDNLLTSTIGTHRSNNQGLNSSSKKNALRSSL